MKIRLKWVVIFLLLTELGTASSCKKFDKKLYLVGTWKVDSAFTYYNGFANIDLDSSRWAEYEYLLDGQMKEIKEGSFLPYTYELERDSLIHNKTNGERFQTYEILQLAPNRMVLRKEKVPIFSGQGQLRYEIRYFSKKK